MKYQVNIRGQQSPIVIQENLYDRCVRYIAPEKAALRMNARFQLAASAQGGYASGERTRGKINRGLGDADRDTLLGRDVMVSDSRDLYRNNPIASGAIESNCLYVVGRGIKPESTIDRKFLGLSDDAADELENQIESEFDYYASSVECDTTRMQNFWRMQYLAHNSTLQSGDALALFEFRKRGGARYGTKLHIVESDRVSNEKFKTDSDKIIAGVEKSSFGEPIGYWVSDKHPGDYANRKNLTWQRKPAYTKDGRRSAILLLHKTRPGQTRGVPYLANVIDSILSIGDYITSDQKKALIQSLFTVFVKKDNPSTDLGLYQPDDETGGTSADKDYKLGTGNMISMGKDESVEMAGSNSPNPNFGPFIDTILTTIGMATGQPVEFLTKKFNSNYTAAKAAINAAERFFENDQQWLIDSLCLPFYENWMWEAVSNGHLNMPGFFDDHRIRAAYLKSEWTGQPIGHVQPVQEVKAQLLKIEGGLSSKQKEAKRNGQNADTVRSQKAKENKKDTAVGLNKESALRTENEKRISEGLMPIPGGNAIFMPSSLIPAIEQDEEA